MSPLQPLHLGELSPGPVLVFGGPYSNLQATEAMRAEAVRLGIPATRVICTGDVVAYCADPEATVELIRDWGINVVLGNCEESLGNGADDCGCGFEEGTACDLLAAGWYRHAQRHLSGASRRWMRALPRAITFSIGGRQVRVVHGGVDQINRFLFTSADDALLLEQLDKASCDLVIGGHCGIPFGRVMGTKAWLNAGVIGMPANDGTRDGWYLLLMTSAAGVQASWHRLPYAAERAGDRMTRSALASGYAEALASGLWPSLDVLPRRERAATGVPIVLERMIL